MADSFDRYDDESQGNGFMMGLLTGAVLGAGIGMLLAPKAGTELRGTIGSQARHLGSLASEQYRRATQSASGWADRGREFVDKAREKVQKGTEELRSHAGASTGSSYGAGETSYGSPGTTSFGGPTAGTDYGHS